MKISEVEEREGRGKGKGWTASGRIAKNASFTGRLRCVQCRWGVWLLESEDGWLRT